MLSFLSMSALLTGVPLTLASTASSSSPLNAVPLQDSLNKIFGQRWNNARAMVQKEQLVEDYNGDYIATSRSAAEACRHRRLIALPLTDAFDPPMGVFSHGHVQTGDKVSLPQCFWSAIQLNDAQVPWLVSISRIPETDNTDSQAASLATGPRVQYIEDPSSATSSLNTNPLAQRTTPTITPFIPLDTTLDKIVAGPLDFRSPSSYIFLPAWMMRSLAIRPGDVVQVDLVHDVPAGSLAKFRPHSQDFAKEISNPQAVLETELRHYSSLVKGSTIAMDYNGKRYWFDVVDCKAAGPKGESVPLIKTQDCDIATDFLKDRETMAELARKRQERLREAALEKKMK